MILVLLLTLVAAGASAAANLGSNSFRSPSGNIACRYHPRGTNENYYDQISCYTENYRFFVGVQTDGRKAWFKRNMPTWSLGPLKLLVQPNAPILGYGRSWWNGGNRTSVRCSSTRDGMTCRAYVGASVHGFFISRATYRVW